MRILLAQSWQSLGLSALKERSPKRFSGRRERGFRQLALVDPAAMDWLNRLDETAPPSLPDSKNVRREIRSVTDWMVDAKCGRIPKTRNHAYQALGGETPPRAAGNTG